MTKTREERQTNLDARVATLRAHANKLLASASAMRATVNDDYAFWTQPAYSNAAGRRFAKQRERERGKVVKAGELAAEAAALHRKADAMEARDVVMAGDALAAHTARVGACAVVAGMMVETTFYGVCRVLKVNRISVLIEGRFGPVKVGKEFVKQCAA